MILIFLSVVVINCSNKARDFDYCSDAIKRNGLVWNMTLKKMVKVIHKTHFAPHIDGQKHMLNLQPKVLIHIYYRVR